MKDIIKEQAVKMKEQTAANYQRQKEREERRKRMDERDKKKKREGAKRRKTELWYGGNYFCKWWARHNSPELTLKSLRQEELVVREKQELRFDSAYDVYT